MRKKRKTDLRVIKTKQKLANTLLEMMTSESIDNIKISSLCTHAGVSRATFYNNFNVIYDVLNYHFENTKNELFNTYMNLFSREHILFEDATKYIAQQVLDYLFINKDVITSIFKSNYSPRLNDMMSSFFKKSIIEFMEHYPEEFGINDPAIKDLLVSFVAGGCSYLLVCFFTSGAHLEKEKVMMTTIEIMNKVFSLAKEKLLA